MTDIEVTVEPIFLTPDEPSGRFRVRVSPDATVETLLRQVCKEANTPCKVDYSLQSKEKSTLRRTDVLSDVGIGDGAYLTLTSEVMDVKRWSCDCNIFWFLALIAFFMGATIITTICIVEYREKHSVTDYAVIFDAGSSHTAMFIYKWEGSKLNGTALAVQSGKKCSSSGGAISKFVSDPFSAGKSLEPCLRQAMSKIPDKRHSKTPIYLGATAGMRILREKNPVASEAILESIRKTFKSYPFKMSDKNVRILEGDEEGTYSWITSNYVTNSFNVLKYLPSNSGTTRPLVIVPTVGALDLGGASTQISFIPAKPDDMPKNFSRWTELFHHNYTLYTHSYACYGVNEINGRVLAALIKENPANDSSIYHACLPDGYSVTKTHEDIFGSPCVSGDMGLESFGSVIKVPEADVTNKNYTFVGESYPAECSALVTSAVFNLTAPCPYSRCSFNGVYQPPINGPFYAFSSFYYVMEFLNLTLSNDHFSYDQFVYALNSLCMLGWDEVKKLPGLEENLPVYCQEANYINTLLTQGYGFSDNTTWQNIHFVKKIFSTEIGWTLGFVLDASNAYPSHSPGETMYQLTFYLLMTLSVLFILVAVGFVIHAFRDRKGNDSVKYHSLGTYGAI